MITFVSCFYIVKSKFPLEKYEKWINYLLPNIKIFNLIIFCDKKTSVFLEKLLPKTQNIKLIILEVENLYNYKYKTYWEINHNNNHCLNNNKHKTSWKLNMLWSEKISFVKNAYENKYFPETEWYGWMDIGYFRPKSSGILSPKNIQLWPNKEKILSLNTSKIYYGIVNNEAEMDKIKKIILMKNNKGLPKNPISPYQISVSGGFFLIYKAQIKWWHDTYDDKLKLYFENAYLVKDDQMIIIDCIYNNFHKFELQRTQSNLNRWFMFQRLLL